MFGHENVSILNGGYASWLAAHPELIERGAPVAPAPGNFVARFQPQGYIAADEVAQLVGKTDTATLLDGRNEAQYYGEAKHPKAAQPGEFQVLSCCFRK